ncbi:MAG TPA: peptide chain release factor-like protein [Tepidisphaeraceae bacterium]|jgi:hypothetical protein|nr:peptide chain release factor-like protein [Tepidisphaeraceae bacterium]
MAVQLSSTDRGLQSAVESTASTRLLSDDVLLKDCRFDIARGSGPGGQKRNKTSNAIRLTHLPTGIASTATESRSQLENKMRAVRRLRLKLAIELREAIDLLTFEPPDYFLQVRRQTRIEISYRHPLYAAVAGLVLDLLKATGGNPTAVAVNLGVSTTSVVKLLEEEPQLWSAANQIRADMGMPALTHRR